MGGGYIECGDFCGGDKSGSAISGVLEAIRPSLPDAACRRLDASDEEARQAFEDGEMGFSLEPELCALLVGPLERYLEQLGEKLGHPDPELGPELDRGAGLDPTEAKWGAGDGWRYYCANDLLTACRLSAENGTPVTISFD